MDAFTYRHAELASQALSLSTTDRHAAVRRRETSEALVAREETS